MCMRECVCVYMAREILYISTYLSEVNRQVQQEIPFYFPAGTKFPCPNNAGKTVRESALTLSPD